MGAEGLIGTVELVKVEVRNLGSVAGKGQDQMIVFFGEGAFNHPLQLAQDVGLGGRFVGHQANVGGFEAQHVLQKGGHVLGILDAAAQAGLGEVLVSVDSNA